MSRVHARIAVDGRAAVPVLEDAGSSYGTWLDGTRLAGARPLHQGSRIRVGDEDLVVDRRRSESEAGLTIVVPPEAMGGVATGRPRLRAGYALKRLEAREGPLRWVLKDAAGGAFVRLGDEDAALVGLVDGRRDVAELVGEAEARLGPDGPARLARLLAQLGDRGLLDGRSPPAAPVSRLGRLVAPRERSSPEAWRLVDRLYDAGGWILFTPAAWVGLAAVAAAGLAAYVAVLLGRYGTPFVVASGSASAGSSSWRAASRSRRCTRPRTR